jgi:hypothetical protein
MKRASRKLLSIIPLGIQFLAAVSSVGVLSFIIRTTRDVIADESENMQFPLPSRLLVEYEGIAKLLILLLFGVSLITFFWTRKKMTDEADQLATQSAVYSIVWYAGIILVSGMIMAGFLPHFAIKGSAE